MADGSGACGAHPSNAQGPFVLGLQALFLSGSVSLLPHRRWPALAPEPRGSAVARDRTVLLFVLLEDGKKYLHSSGLAGTVVPLSVLAKHSLCFNLHLVFISPCACRR